MYSNVTFVTHLRYDHTDRVKNLQAILNYYSLYCKNSKFIIVEDDNNHNTNFDSVQWPKGTTYFLLKNKGPWHKTKSLNYGIKQSLTPVVVALDTDCIIPIKSLKKCVDAVMDDATMTYPYNGYVIDVSYRLRDLFISSDYNYSILSKQLPPVNTLKLGQAFGAPETHFYVRCTNINPPGDEFHLGVGGVVVFNKDRCIEMGGYNEKFVCWGGEDNEIDSRCIKLGYKQFRDDDIDAVCFHLYHHNATRHNNPCYESNMAELDRIDPKNISKDDLIDYIKTWNNFK